MIQTSSRDWEKPQAFSAGVLHSRGLPHCVTVTPSVSCIVLVLWNTHPAEKAAKTLDESPSTCVMHVKF